MKGLLEKERQIIALFFAREEQAILETQQKYGKRCHSVAKNILGSQQDAQECVNDTNTWNQTETMGTDGASLHEYAPRPDSNSYILCSRGQYYPAVRHDSDGYHGLTD